MCRRYRLRVLTTLLDGRVFAERTGDAAPTVLALHGWGRTRADLLPVVKGHAALVPDLPGFGSSPAPERPWGSRDYAELLAPLLGDGTAWTVLGHSFGGRVAVQLAALRPDLVQRVVLTGVPLLRRQQQARSPLAYRLARELHRRGALPEAVLDRARQRYGSQDYRAASGVMRDTLVRLVNEDYADVLPRLHMPVDLVWGAHDDAAPLEMAGRALDLLPAGTLQQSDTSGHLLDAGLVDLLRTRLAAPARPGAATPA